MDSARYRMRRSLFFVPGGEPRKLEKSLGAGADTLLFDLEDAVVPEEKERARSLVAETLRTADFGGSEPAVRINAPGTPFFEEDLHTVVEAGAGAVMLPKSDSAEGLAAVGERIEALERGLGRDADEGVRILALVESAAGIGQLGAMGAAHARVDALCFGHADFSRDMGLAEADASEGVVLHARCQVAIAARAAGLAPVDTVCLAVRDAEAFRRDVEHGLRLGFDGKLCIHPAQVPIANQVYTPSADQVALAERVLEGWENARAEGRGVFALDGKMVDAPIVAVQERILERARRARERDGTA